jgi:hypothetical protein
MRAKLLLALCLATMPMCLVGCDSAGENQVGTGSNEPPPDVKKRIEEQNAMYQKMQQEQSKNPTPQDGRGGGGAPAGG